MIIVVGENVVDLVPAGRGLLRSALGGGPANTAVAAARLGAPVALAARLSRDAFGAAFRARLAAAGVDGRYLISAIQPSALALATVSPDGVAQYDFWLAGAADFCWRDAELPVPPPGAVLHLASLAAFLPPGADVVERWARRHRPQCMVTFDPNLRPVALARPDSLVRLERLVDLAHVVRLSDDDALLAYPDVAPLTTARRWVAQGPALVVLTHGPGGATALSGAVEVTVPAPDVPVVDTIGAGDTVMGALLTALHRRGVLSPAAIRTLTSVELTAILRYACTAAALACTRPGAHPPSGAEVDAALSGQNR